MKIKKILAALLLTLILGTGVYCVWFYNTRTLVYSHRHTDIHTANSIDAVAYDLNIEYEYGIRGFWVPNPYAKDAEYEMLYERCMTEGIDLKKYK